MRWFCVGAEGEGGVVRCTFLVVRWRWLLNGLGGCRGWGCLGILRLRLFAGRRGFAQDDGFVGGVCG